MKIELHLPYFVKSLPKHLTGSPTATTLWKSCLTPGAQSHVSWRKWPRSTGSGSPPSTLMSPPITTYRGVNLAIVGQTRAFLKCVVTGRPEYATWDSHQGRLRADHPAVLAGDALVGHPAHPVPLPVHQLSQQGLQLRGDPRR